MKPANALFPFLFVLSLVTAASAIAVGCGDDSSTTEVELDASADTAFDVTTPDASADASTDSTTDAPANDSAADVTTDASPAAPGLDPTFGDGGLVTVSGAVDSEDGIDALRQPDGKLLVLAWNQSHYQIELFRLTTAGALDPTFGTAGRVITWTADGTVSASLALQSDGKILALGRGTTDSPTVLQRFDSAGKLDSTFGTGGTMLLASFLGGGVTTQADDKIVLGGSRKTAGNAGWEFVAMRLTATGAVDTTFNTTGTTSITFGAGLATDSAFANKVAVDPNGKIVLAGEYRAIGGNLSAAVARLDSAGALDTTFNTTGKALMTASAANNTQAYSLAVQSDAKVVIGGTFGSQMFVGRLSADGTPDTTFGGANNGMFVSSAIPGSSRNVVGLAIAPSGAIYAGVARQVLDAYVARLTPLGVFDTTFASTGYAIVPTEMSFGGIVAMPDESVISTGSHGVLNGSSTSVTKNLADGGVDTTFGTSGNALININATKDTASAVVTQPDGKMAVAGIASNVFGLGALRRYTSSGALDTAFGGSGGFTGLGFSFPRSLAFHPLGGLVVVGGYGTFDVTRTTPAGQPDTTFGTSQGRASFTLETGDNAWPTCVRVDGTGRVIAAGWSIASGGGGSRLALARLTTAGVPDTTFAGTGKVLTPIGAGASAALALAIQVDGKPVVVGYAEGTGGRHDMAVLRYDAAGVLDTTFVGDAAGNGIVTTDASTTDKFEYARAVAIAGDGKIVVAGNAAANAIDNYGEYAAPHYGPSSIVVARYLIDGKLDTTFGTGGKVIIATAGAEQLAHAVQIMPDGKIVIAGRRFTTAREDGILMRLQSNGAIDTTFATAGTYALTLGNASAFFDLAAQADGKLIAAGRIFSSATGYDFAFVRVTP